MPRKVFKKRKLPKAQIGTKSSAKVRGAISKPNTASSKTTQQKNTKMNKVANKTRKSSAVASVSTSQPAKMSPVKATKQKVAERKAASFDKAKKKNGKSVVRKPRRKVKKGRR